MPARASTRSLWFLVEHGDEMAGSRSAASTRASRAGLGRVLGVRAVARQGLGRALLLHAFARVPTPRRDAGRRSASTPTARPARIGSTRAPACAVATATDMYERSPGVSRLRARCPDCRTFTAVALDGDYECHACGRPFAAGLVRVPRAWGEAARRWPRPPGCRCPIRRPPCRGDDARRADARARGDPAGAPARPRRLLLLSCRSRRRARRRHGRLASSGSTPTAT